jgi:hypothetical protein
MFDVDIVSLVASTSAWYFDFIKNNAIHVCFFVHQVIGVLLIVKIYALVDFHSFASPPPICSTKTKKFQSVNCP